MLSKQESVYTEDANIILAQLSVDEILKDPASTIRKTKIVCTLGPTSHTTDQIVKMIDAGMNIGRFNFSHGDHPYHKATFKALKEALKMRPEYVVSAMLDTKGPEVRTGFLKGHQAVNITSGQSLEITTDYSIEGDNNIISCSYEKLPKYAKVGGRILIADGTLQCEITSVKEKSIVVKVLSSAKLGEKKNMNLQSIQVDIPTLIPQDEEDIKEFCINQGFDMIAMSFTRCAKDIIRCRELLGAKAASVKIIAKIENRDGLYNFEEILKEADGIMVARGDLGMEIPAEKVCVFQKWMITKCNLAGKPVITATQMMESMVKNPNPTRAEATDIANAVLDGTDCVMLSGETACGDFPIEAITIMSRICIQSECSVDYKGNFNSMKRNIRVNILTNEASARAVVSTAMDLV